MKDKKAANKLEFWIELSIIEYAKDACKKQREICSNEIEPEDMDDIILYEATEAIRALVKNAHEPKLK